jgi:hypothetical protein
MRYAGLVLLSVSVFTVLVASGCKKTTPNAGGDTESSNSDNSYEEVSVGTVAEGGARSLERATELWEQGSEKEAVEVFVGTEWGGPFKFSADSVLALSEKEFIALPAAKRSDVQQKVMALTRTIRMLTEHVRSLGRNALANGRHEVAESHLNAVINCGKALSSADTLQIIKLTGSAIQKAAGKELGELPGESGN